MLNNRYIRSSLQPTEDGLSPILPPAIRAWSLIPTLGAQSTAKNDKVVVMIGSVDAIPPGSLTAPRDIGDESTPEVRGE